MAAYAKLLKLECEAQNEPYGDEPYLTWDGRIVWGRTPDNEGKKGTVWDLQKARDTNCKPYPDPCVNAIDLLRVKNDGSLLKLREYDPDTPDDDCGSQTIWPSEVGQGQKKVKLEGDDAKYWLTYEVISV